jgi:HEAT repeat protein
MTKRDRFLVLAALGASVLALARCGSTTTGGAAGKPSGAAAGGSGALPPPESASVAQLRDRLRDPEVFPRIQTVDELGKRAASSPEAVAVLIEALGDSSPLVRRFAAGGLANAPVTESTVRALIPLLKDPENDPRETAARSLASIAPKAPASVAAELGSALLGAVDDREAVVRSHAVEALGGLGARGARLVPQERGAFERALRDPSEDVRASAAEAVGNLGTRVPWTVALLTKALADPVHDVRKMAVVALEKMGPAAAPATKAIARLLTGQEIYLRVFACDALAAIGPGARAALPDLKALKARGWKDIKGSAEVEAGQLPEAVAKAIRAIEGKGKTGKTR